MMKQERLIQKNPEPAMAGRSHGGLRLSSNFGAEVTMQRQCVATIYERIHHAYHPRKPGGRIFE